MNTIALDTAKEFIEYIGKGYVVWRYILVENKKVPPKIHLGLMLETWRALVDLVDLRGSNSTPRTVDKIIEQDYIMDMYRDAESDDEWQAISQDENSGVELRELYDWFMHNQVRQWAGQGFLAALFEATPAGASEGASRSRPRTPRAAVRRRRMGYQCVAAGDPG